MKTYLHSLFVIIGVLPEKKVEVQDNEMDLTVDDPPPIPPQHF